MRERPASPRWLLLAVAAFALVIRLVGLDFDQNHFFHPDERAIGDAILKLSFHPLQLNPHFFAYGSLPFYLTKALSSFLAEVSGHDWFSSYDGVVHVGRFLSALAGALTVLLVAAVGRRLYGQKAGLLAGFLLALAASGRLARRGRGRDALLAGALTGFSLATKASAAPLLLPLAVAVFLACRPERAWRKGTLLLTAAGLAVLVAFFLGEPYAFLDFHEFWRSVSEQGAMVRHAGLVQEVRDADVLVRVGHEARVADHRALLEHRAPEFVEVEERVGLAEKERDEDREAGGREEKRPLAPGALRPAG